MNDVVFCVMLLTVMILFPITGIIISVINYIKYKEKCKNDKRYCKYCRYSTFNQLCSHPDNTTIKKTFYNGLGFEESVYMYCEDFGFCNEFNENNDCNKFKQQSYLEFIHGYSPRPRMWSEEVVQQY